MIKISHLGRKGYGNVLVGRTVDGNGNALGENVVVSALKGWDLSETVDLAVVIGDTLAWLGVNNLEVELVGLGDSKDSGGTGVTLGRKSVIV